MLFFILFFCHSVRSSIGHRRNCWMCFVRGLLIRLHKMVFGQSPKSTTQQQRMYTIYMYKWMTFRRWAPIKWEDFQPRSNCINQQPGQQGRVTGWEEDNNNKKTSMSDLNGALRHIQWKEKNGLHGRADYDENM